MNPSSRSPVRQHVRMPARRSPEVAQQPRDHLATRRATLDEVLDPVDLVGVVAPAPRPRRGADRPSPPQRRGALPAAAPHRLGGPARPRARLGQGDEAVGLQRRCRRLLAELPGQSSDHGGVAVHLASVPVDSRVVPS